jgi:hypothetical protein
LDAGLRFTQVHKLLQIGNSQTKFVTVPPPSSMLALFSTTIKAKR